MIMTGSLQHNMMIQLGLSSFVGCSINSISPVILARVVSPIKVLVEYWESGWVTMRKPTPFLAYDGCSHNPEDRD